MHKNHMKRHNLFLGICFLSKVTPNPLQIPNHLATNYSKAQDLHVNILLTPLKLQNCSGL